MILGCDTRRLGIAVAAGAAVGAAATGTFVVWYLRRLRRATLCEPCEAQGEDASLSALLDDLPMALTTRFEWIEKAAQQMVAPIVELRDYVMPEAASLQSSGKREGALSWDDYFMALAFLSAQRSKDPYKQVGAVIVSNTNIILSIGYNGFPRGIPDEKLPWGKSGDLLDTKYPYVCHAEANAILNANTDKMTGQRIYVTMFPCNECAKLVIQAGLVEVIYCEFKGPPYKRPQDRICYEASKRLLSLAGVKLRQHCLQSAISIHSVSSTCEPCKSQA